MKHHSFILPLRSSDPLIPTWCVINLQFTNHIKLQFLGQICVPGHFIDEYANYSKLYLLKHSSHSHIPLWIQSQTWVPRNNLNKSSQKRAITIICFYSVYFTQIHKLYNRKKSTVWMVDKSLGWNLLLHIIKGKLLLCLMKGRLFMERKDAFNFVT